MRSLSDGHGEQLLLGTELGTGAQFVCLWSCTSEMVPEMTLALFTAFVSGGGYLSLALWLWLVLLLVIATQGIYTHPTWLVFQHPGSAQQLLLGIHGTHKYSPVVLLVEPRSCVLGEGGCSP